MCVCLSRATIPLIWNKQKPEAGKRILLSIVYSAFFVLQGQADLLKYAKNEALENLKQIHYATLSCGLNKPGTENAEISKPRRSLEVIPEKAGDENGEWENALLVIMEFVTLWPIVAA